MSNIQTMSLADALRGGESAEEIMKQFEDALNAAKRQVAAEQEKAKAKEDATLAATRADMVEAMLDYLVALGVIKSEVTDKDVEDLVSAIKSAEEDFRRTSKLLDAYKMFDKSTKGKGKKDADSIIEEFLKSL